MAMRAKTRRKAPARVDRTATLQELERRALTRQLRVTREVVSLTKQLKRAVERADHLLLDMAGWAIVRLEARMAPAPTAANVVKNGVPV